MKMFGSPPLLQTELVSLCMSVRVGSHCTTVSRLFSVLILFHVQTNQELPLLPATELGEWRW